MYCIFVCLVFVECHAFCFENNFVKVDYILITFKNPCHISQVCIAVWFGIVFFAQIAFISCCVNLNIWHWYLQSLLYGIHVPLLVLGPYEMLVLVAMVLDLWILACLLSPPSPFCSLLSVLLYSYIVHSLLRWAHWGI